MHSSSPVPLLPNPLDTVTDLAVVLVVGLYPQRLPAQGGRDVDDKSGGAGIVGGCGLEDALEVLDEQQPAEAVGVGECLCAGLKARNEAYANCP